MPNRLAPTNGYDLSDKLLSRSMLNNPLRDFLRYAASRDRVTYFNDFLEDTINLDYWAVAASGTGVAFNQTTVALNGIMIATTANVDNASVSAIGPAIYRGQNNCEFEVRLKGSVATDVQWEVGWIDVAQGSNAPAITDVDVPTIVATNAALFAQDTDQTHTGIAFVSIGNYTGQTVASTLITSGFTSPVADTYFTVKVLLLADPDATNKAKAFCWVNGKLVAKHADTDADGYVNGAQLLAPWIFFRTRAAATPTVSVDYVRITQDRQATE